MADRDHRRRLGKVMAFEDASGNDYAEAFAVLSAFAFDAGDEGGTVSQLRMVMRLWKSRVAYDEGKRPLAVSGEGTEKTYYLVGPEFDRIMEMTYQGMPVAKVITDIAWIIAQSIKDVQVEPASETNPAGTHRSFFEEAKDV